MLKPLNPCGECGHPYDMHQCKFPVGGACPHGDGRAHKTFCRFFTREGIGCGCDRYKYFRREAES